MKIKLLTACIGVALSGVAINADAQKTINEGVAKYSTEVQGQPADAMQYFKAYKGSKKDLADEEYEKLKRQQESQNP